LGARPLPLNPDPRETPTETKQKGFARFLGVIERVGNTLPHPATLFAFGVIVFS